MLLALSLAACTTAGTTPTGVSSSSEVRSGYGTVESVQRVDRDNVGLLGTIGGAVVGGLLGNQIGSGRGQTAATIAGAAGGAYAGREIERRTRSASDVFKIYVRMDDGSYQAIAQETHPALRAGDRVRVENGVVTPI
ncbi:MAG: glycine zipper 2TM domain-containing protein [Burkholderiales bacterium]|nr:glycine zipper 2TM domain-containing protein [Burkholderiales bacterium]